MTLKEFKKSRGMTLETLAVITGYTKGGLSKWINERETLPDELIDIIQRKFGVTLEKTYSVYGALKNKYYELKKECERLKEEIERLKARPFQNPSEYTLYLQSELKSLKKKINKIEGIK